MNPSYRLLSFTSLSTSDYQHLIQMFRSTYQQCSTHTLSHACTHCRYTVLGGTRVPGDQLVLLKMHGLNISHVNICVISTVERLVQSRETQ